MKTLQHFLQQALVICIYCGILSANNATAEDSNEGRVRVLVSTSTRVKRDYILTDKELEANASRKSDFGKIKWTLPELVKKAENHINKELMAEISPTIKWPPERYNRGYEHPFGAPHLDFIGMEFSRHRDYTYILMEFHFRGPVGELLELNVVAYLNGRIARIGDHDPKTARIIPP